MGDLEGMVAETKALVSAIISKPKMSEKLLAKPPFRFLHDTVSGIFKATGFGEGLFSGDELNSKALKEKPQKLGYLDKLIAFVKEQSGMDLAVKSSKIVAGAEPINTNEMLQVIAKLATGDLKSGGGGGGAGAGNGEAEAKEEAAKEAEAAEQARREHEAAEAAKREREAADAAAAEEAARRREQEEEESRRRAEEDARRRAEEAEAEASSKLAAANNTPAPSSGGGGPTTPEALGCDGTPDKTRELVGGLITKPKLSDKLLSKPPMRFLHDIVMNVGKSTGWGAGLFEDAELDAANVKSKPAKLAFLDKVTRCVGLQLNAVCPARPAKIVAGAEADNTNTMIQMIGLCAARGPDDDAVRRTLAGEKPGEAAAAAAAPAPAPSRRSDDDSKLAAEREAQAREAEAAERARREAEDAKIAAAQQRAREKAEQAAQEAAAAEDARMAAQQQPSSASTPMTAAIPSSSSSGQPTRSARPQTAGRRPPRVKDNTTVSAAAQPVPTARAVGVMREGTDAESESDDEAPEAGAGDFGTAFDAGGAGAGAGAGARISASAAVGKHTRDILNEEKKSESKEPSTAMGSTPAAPSGGGIKMGRIKKSRGDMGSFSQVELDNLRDAIQKLCRSTDPLGRSMEYVHEDMDVMKRELTEWRTEHAKHNDTMTAELQATEDSLNPLKRELSEMDDKLVEQQTKIHAAKATIAKNDVRIQDLLRMVVSQ